LKEGRHHKFFSELV